MSQSGTSSRSYYVDSSGVLRGRGGDEGRPATDAERWFQAERDRFGEALEQIRDQDWMENVLDPQWAARIAKEALDG